MLPGVNRLMYLADAQHYQNYVYPGYKFLETFATGSDAALVVAFLANDMEAKPKLELGSPLKKK